MHENQENHELEFRYYDASRDSSNTASLSPEWRQALEGLANRKDMSQALQNLLDDQISRIERQPDLLENEYLPKLRQFVKEVGELPEDNANYLYKAAVVGTSGSTNPTAKEGIIIRFLRKLDKRFKTSQQRNFAQSTNILVQEVIPGEIVVDYPVDSHENKVQ